MRPKPRSDSGRGGRAERCNDTLRRASSSIAVRHTVLGVGAAALVQHAPLEEAHAIAAPVAERRIVALVEPHDEVIVATIVVRKVHDW